MELNITQLIAFIFPFVVLLGAIVAGAWINQRALEKQMDAFRNEITAVMAAFKAEVKAELTSEIAPMRADLSQVKHSVEKIERQLEAVFSRFILPK